MKSKLFLALFSLVTVCTTVQPVLAAGTAREVTLTANDSMQYNLKEITAKPGEVIRLKLSHIGKMPKAAMGHNWVLLKTMTPAELNAIAIACAKNAPLYLPKDMSLVLAHTKILGGGESDTIEVTAPATAGEHPYLCTFPGHFTMMKGKLIVK
jgi:azurin